MNKLDFIDFGTCQSLQYLVHILLVEGSSKQTINYKYVKQSVEVTAHMDV